MYTAYGLGNRTPGPRGLTASSGHAPCTRTSRIISARIFFVISLLFTGLFLYTCFGPQVPLLPYNLLASPLCKLCWVSDELTVLAQVSVSHDELRQCQEKDVMHYPGVRMATGSHKNCCELRNSPSLPTQEELTFKFAAKPSRSSRTHWSGFGSVFVTLRRSW